MNSPLKNIRVLDFTRVLAGPYCTMLLADMGAEVIKIERPDGGDDTRHFGPFTNNESGYFMYLNRGKKSIALDLKTREAIAAVNALVEKSDVLIENFRPGVMKKLGLDYETLRQVNPKLVYTSISGFGQYGPYSQRGAYDLIAQAMGGMMSITGYEDTPPTRTGSSLGDMSAAMYAAYGTMVALFHRQQTGEGQFVDVAMMDSIFSLLESNIMRYTIDNITPQRIGSRHPLSSPFDVYAGKNGYVVIAIANDSLFSKLCTFIGKPELAEHPKFSTDPQRKVNENELKAIIEEWLKQHDVHDVVERANNNGIPCAPISTVNEVCESEHIKVREMLVEIEHPVAGTIKIPGHPVKFSNTPAVIKDPSPGLGEHTDEILQNVLNYDQAKVKELLAK